MINDYESFVIGLQIGYRIGRPEPNRKPPVPSENYMITEIDEDRMITESGNPMVTE